MFEAYSVAVTLKLNNLVSPQFVLLAKELEKLDLLVKGLKSSLKGFGAEARGFRSLTTAADGTNRALERASVSAERLQAHLARARATAASMPAVAPHLPGGAAGGAGGGGNPPRHPGGGGGAGRGHGGRGGVHGGNIHLGPHGVGIGSIGMAAGDAFVPLALSAGMIYAGHALYESAKDLNTEQQRFKLFGLGDKLNTEAFKFVQGMRIYGTTQTENMKGFREAQGIFRESGLNDSAALEGAKLAAPVLAKIAFATESLNEESKARMQTSSLSMLRWVEMSGGLKSAAEFNRLADFGWKMVQTSGGAVDWEQLRQFSATAGNAGRFITPEGLAALEPLLGELKGGGAGTGLRTATNRITGVVKIPNQVAHMLVDNGLWDQSKIEWNKQGGIKQFKSNPFTGYDDYIKNPAQWYEKTMMPLYEKLKFSQEERGRENSMLFGGTGGRLFTLLELQLQASHHSVEGQKKALGIDASVDVAKKSLSGQEKEFTSAWTDFKTVFGTSALPAFSNLLTNGANFLRSIDGFMGSASVKSFIDAYKSPGTFWKSALGLKDEANYGHEGYAHEGGGRKGFATNVGGAAFGNGKSVLNPATAASSESSRPVQLVLKDGGRPLAEVVSSQQAKRIGTNLGSGSYDLGVSQPAVNVRTN